MEPDITIKTDEEESIKTESNGNVSKYVKGVVLKYLKEHGCTRDTLETVAWARRNNQQDVIDYICDASEKALTRVNQECDSVSLSNINNWLDLLNTAELSSHCEYEAAAVLNAIVHTEKQPEPDELGGIDMREVYGFLENALTGQPQKKLSAAGEVFLSREIGVLIEEANSEHSDDVARCMGQALYSQQEFNYEEKPNKCSLDPLFCDK